MRIKFGIMRLFNKNFVAIVSDNDNDYMYT